MRNAGNPSPDLMVCEVPKGLGQTCAETRGWGTGRAPLKAPLGASYRGSSSSNPRPCMALQNPYPKGMGQKLV